MFTLVDSNFCSKLRTLWYVFMALLKDEDTQMKGAVGIYYNVGANARREPLSVLRRVHYTRTGIPKRIAGMHYCYDDTKTRPFIAGLRLFLDQAARSRFRTHFGSRMEITFGLQTYGIPTNDHPILLGQCTRMPEYHRPQDYHWVSKEHRDPLSGRLRSFGSCESRRRLVGYLQP